MAKFAFIDNNKFMLMYWSPVILIKFAFIMHQAKQGGLELQLPQIISLRCSCVQLPIVRTSVNAIAKAGEQFNIQNIMFKMFDT